MQLIDVFTFDMDEGPYVHYSEVQEEIEKRDAMIVALKAECAILAARLVDYDYHAEEKMKLRDSIIADLRSATSDAQAEIQKRDARIAELESQLAACAAGLWRKPTDEEEEWMIRCESFNEIESVAYNQDKIIYQEHIHAPLLIADINPPEKTQTC